MDDNIIEGIPLRAQFRDLNSVKGRLIDLLQCIWVDSQLHECLEAGGRVYTKSLTCETLT